MECLESLIGLSATVPKCFIGTPPVGYDVSESGYYLNDADYGMRVVEGCDLDGWTLLADAKASAIRHFKTDLRAALYNNNDSAFNPFSGLIGQTPHSGPDTSFSKPYSGVQISVNGTSRGMFLVIKAAYLGLSITGSYTITVKSNNPDFVAVSYTMNATANSYQKNVLTEELKIPLYSKHFCDTDDEMKYWVEVELQGAKPLNGKINCCGGRPGWMEFAEVNGYGASGSNLEFIETSTLNRGLVLQAYLMCDDLEWICTLSEMGGYQTKDVIARAIQYRGGVAAYGLLLDRNILSLCTMYNMEAINAHRSFLTQKYGEYINWISENVPIGASSCFKCKRSSYYEKASMLL